MQLNRLVRILIGISLGTALAGAQTAATYIGQLVRPGMGDDGPARLGLRSMTNKSFRPGAESERSSHEGALLTGLSSRTEWEVKSFLIDELALQGKTVAVAPISAYLSDANLCEPAAYALRMVAATEGADKVLSSLRPALVSAKGKCRVSVVNALGTLRDAESATVEALLKDAAAVDKDLKAVALRALAEIGDGRGKAILAEALKAADLFERNRAVSLNLVFALRLAERGLKSEGIEIANAVKVQGASGNRPDMVMNADTTLARIGRTVAIAARPGPRGIGADPAVFRQAFALEVADLRGRVVRRHRGDAGFAMGAGLAGLPPGVYRVRWTSGFERGMRAVLVP